MTATDSRDATITCRELEAFVLDYLEGELTPFERGEFEKHLEACPHCTIYLEAYQVAVALGAGGFNEPAAPVPESVPSELVTAILAARGRKTG